MFVLIIMLLSCLRQKFYIYKAKIPMYVPHVLMVLYTQAPFMLFAIGTRNL
jgi:hypothetical protein